MNSQQQSELKRGQNEVVFREHNDAIKKQIKSILPDAEKSTFPINFVCECSDERCREQLEMTAVDYERVHRHPRRFVTKPGHSQSDIEKVIESNDVYAVNEKFQTPPVTEGPLNVTDSEERLRAGNS